MALTFAGNVAASFNKTAGTSTTIPTTAGGAVGDVICLTVSCDNTGTVDGTAVNQVTAVAIGGNTFIKGGEYVNSNAAAGTGIVCSVWYCKLTEAFTTGANIAITFSASLTAKAVVASKFTSTGSAIALGGVNTGFADLAAIPAITLSGLTSRNYVWYRGIAWENNAAIVSSNSSSWASGGNTFSTGGSQFTNVGANAEYRVFTATSLTSNPTTLTNADGAGVLIALYEVVETRFAVTTRTLNNVPQAVNVNEKQNVAVTAATINHAEQVVPSRVDKTVTMAWGTMFNIGQTVLKYMTVGIPTVPVFINYGTAAVVSNAKRLVPVGITVTWDPLSTGDPVTLSNGNLTATAVSAGSLDQSVRATVPITGSDKVFWENAIDAASAPALRIGVTNGSDDLIGETANSLGYGRGGGVRHNGVTIATIAAFTAGDVVDVALDRGASLIWFRVNGGDWNNSGSADPATGTGGFSIGVTGDLYPALSFGAGTGTSAVTANFSASGVWDIDEWDDFIWGGYAAPAGFGSLNDLYGTLVSYSGVTVAWRNGKQIPVVAAAMAYVPQSVAANAKRLVPVTNGQMTYLWQTSSVNAKRTISVAFATMQYAGKPTTVNVRRTVTVTPAVMTYSGQAASANAKRIITTGAGSMLYTGMPITRNAKKTAVVVNATVTYAGQPVLRSTRTIASAATVTYAGQPMSVSAKRTVTVTFGTIAYVPKAIARSTRIGVTSGLMMYVWQPSGVNAKKVITVASRTISYTGQPITANVSSGTQVNTGVMTYTGQPIALNVKRNVAVAPATMVYAGKVTNVNAKRAVPVAYGVMTYSGKVALTTSKRIVAAGIMAYVGKLTTLNKRKAVIVTAGNMAYLGQSAGTNSPRKIVVTATMTYTGAWIDIGAGGGPAIQGWGDPLKGMFGMGSRS